MKMNNSSPGIVVNGFYLPINYKGRGSVYKSSDKVPHPRQKSPDKTGSGSPKLTGDRKSGNEKRG
jgi:hypothetical protein